MSTYQGGNAITLKSYIPLLIFISILECIAIKITPIVKPNEEARVTPSEVAGGSRGFLNFAKFIPRFVERPRKRLGHIGSSSPQRSYQTPRVYQVITPNSGDNGTVNGVKLKNITKADHKVHIRPAMQLEHNVIATPTLDELERALLEAGEECGKVPLFENQYKRSINESFGTNPDPESEGDVRILNGLDSLVGEWPWIVRIKKCDNDGQNCKMCTGTLLNSRWVITAGHCQLPNVAVNEYKATIGLYDLLTPDERSFDVSFDKLFRHPDYQDLTNDLLLIRLAKPVQFNDQVQPACFIHRTRNIHAFTKHRKCYTVGYGLTNGMMDAIKLQKLEITTKDPSECNSDQLGSVKLRRGTVCVGPPNGKEGGSCKGDSGGPDLCYDPKGDRWVLFGTVSYGPSVCDREQGEKWLTVSTDLSNFRTWILSTIYHNK